MSSEANGTSYPRDAWQRYQQLVVSLDGIVWEADARTFQFTFVSQQAERLLGYPLEHWLRPGFWVEHLHPEDRVRAVEFCRRATAEKRNHTLEYRMIAADGRIVWLRDIVTVIIEGGESSTVCGIMVDVTERVRTENALREREALFRLLTENSQDLIFLLNLQGRIIYASPSVNRLLGVIPQHNFQIVHPEDVPGAQTCWERVLAGETILWTGRVADAQGRWHWLEALNSRIDYQGQPCVLSVCRDITERKQAEQALAESHGLLNAVVEGIADAVFVKDLRGRYRLINSAGARFLGKTVDQILGKDDRQMFDPDTARQIKEQDLQVMATGQVQSFEQTATVAGVTRTYLSTKGPHRDAQGKVIGLIGIARDVTELKRLEEQFRLAQKIEAVGRLAGGVAHDFNNLLTVINGFSELVFSTLDENDPNREMLAEIQKAGERAANLTRQLLAFSRKQVLQPQVVSLNVLLGELGKLLKRLIGEDIELTLRLDPDTGLVNVDPAQFEQAVINLAVNARDAMPQGGRLLIETCPVELEETLAQGQLQIQPGRYVVLTVSDNGHGMDEATRIRIFEPFFTTKELGKGTGLGLAMVHGFVTQSGGHIEVDSTLGRGTTFKIYLPRVEEVVPSAVSLPDPTDLLRVPRGSETILLVEDEDSVRTLSRLVLESRGYTVLEARDGMEGVQIAQQHSGPIDLLVTDMVMPRMSGQQMAELLTQSRPGLQILFTSGYPDEAIVRHGSFEPGQAFLQKPFTPLRLARKVREVLDGLPSRHLASQEL